MDKSKITIKFTDRDGAKDIMASPAFVGTDAREVGRAIIPGELGTLRGILWINKDMMLTHGDFFLNGLEDYVNGECKAYEEFIGYQWGDSESIEVLNNKGE